MSKIEEEIKKTKVKLDELFKEVPENKKEVIKILIDELAFMIVNLKYLKKDIIEKGPVEIFENGSQVMRRENPAQKSYTALINRFNNSFEKAINLIPVLDNSKDEEKQFDDILKGFK